MAEDGQAAVVGLAAEDGQAAVAGPAADGQAAVAQDGGKNCNTHSIIALAKQPSRQPIYG